jgi:hypothetical protein
MKNNLTIALVAAGVLVLIGIGYFAFRGDKSTYENTGTNTDTSSNTASTTGDMVKYTDPGVRFYFYYPKDFKVSGPTNTLTRSWRSNATTNGYLLSKVVIPKSYMPGTNFSDAAVTVGVSTDPRELGGAGCPAGDTGTAPGSATAETINDQTFTKITNAEAAAGNRYDTKSYFTIRDGDCYVIESVVHSTNIGNYPASSGIKEFDKDKIDSLIDEIVKSFTFTINSD